MKNDSRKSKNQSEVNELVNISKAAFETNVEVGAERKGGPPDYDNVNWYMQMAKGGHLFTAIEEDKVIGGAIVFPSEKKELYIGRIFTWIRRYGMSEQMHFIISSDIWRSAEMKNVFIIKNSNTGKRGCNEFIRIKIACTGKYSGSISI